ncbi:tetratricopeptide repeat protein [Embleya sp. NPDC020630]|uniref:tetratricopeptide repeat protein n=1 Tax=Embleya sp. NPDC020630 TaxID=3363979 RepID=UPI0037983C03
MNRSTRALIDRAERAWDRQEWARAADRYERLLAAEPDHALAGQWAFDAALAHKFLRDWRKAFAVGRQAAALVPPPGTGDPAHWNLGIAATVLGDWETARASWRAYGIDIAPGTGEIDQDFGITCVRLDTPEGREVVWARRICPTRAVVLNVPLSPARRFGDIVLHDGVPEGERVMGGDTYPVFDELLLWRASDMPTWTAEVTAPAEADFDALETSFTERDFALEASAGIRMLCGCCAEGRIEQERTSGHGVGVGVRIAAPEAEARSLLNAWADLGDTRSWTDLVPV